MTVDGWGLAAELQRSLNGLVSRASPVFVYDLAQNKESMIRRLTAEALGNLRKPGTLRSFRRGMYPNLEHLIGLDRSWWKWRLAVRALTRVGRDRALTLLLQMLQDKDPDVRLAAARSLTRIQPVFVGFPPSSLPAILVFHPEWAENPPPVKQIRKMFEVLSWLPPVGGKIPHVV